MSRRSLLGSVQDCSLESRELLSSSPLPVLLVIADQQHFFYREYNDTRNSLIAGGVNVVVAATTTNPSTAHANSGQGAGNGVVVPNIALANVNPNDYSAIAFVGGWGSSMYQYAFNDPDLNGTTNNFYQDSFYNGDNNLNDGIMAQQKVIVNNLINNFIANDKYVAGVCHGTMVLAWARVNGVSPISGKQVTVPLKDGSPAMTYNGVFYGNGYVMGQYLQMTANGGISNNVQGSIGTAGTTTDDVVVDGKIITGSDDFSAAYFGQVIAERVWAALPPANLAPTNINLSANSIAENQAVGTSIGTLSSVDPDAGNTHTYTLVSGTGSTDNASFTIEGNTLKSAASFNFEAKNSYSIRVRTTDQGGLTFEKVFTINVTNSNESPTDISLSANSIAENQSIGTSIGMLSSVDPDAGNTFTYSLVTGTGSDDNASFTIDGNTLKTGASFNFEAKNSYSIRVRATDQGGLTFEKVFTINVTNSNESPTDISLSANSIAENQASGATVGNLSTNDPDAGNTFTYSLVTGTGSDDNASFTIDGNTLKTGASFNFEAKNSYSIRVRTTDQGGLSFEKVFTINVTNVNESPISLQLSNGLIEESQAIGTVIGTLSTNDPDSGNTFNYTLVSGTGSTDNASFTIDGNVLKSNAVFDFNAQTAYSIRVRSTDQDGLSEETVFQITVTNLNQSPTNINLSANTLTENLPVGSTIGNFTSVDPDAGNSFSYTLVPGEGSIDNALFSIDGSVLKSASVFNFEAKNSYSIRVRTTDQGGMTFDKVFTIIVTNSNESPTDVSLSANTITENAAVGTAIGTLSSTDLDAGNTFTYSLVPGTGSADNASFMIDGNTVKSAGAIDFETKNSYTIRVRTTDQGGLSTEKVFTITVLNQNEAPFNLQLSNGSIAEASAVGTPIGSFTATDLEADALTYSLVFGTGDTDNARFTLDGNVLKSAEIFDEQVQSSFSIRVRASDPSGLGFESTFTIVVTPINDAPTLDNSPTLLLPAILRNVSNPEGVSVYTLLAHASDEETPNSLGIALTGKHGIDGFWEHAPSASGPWQTIGFVTDSASLLLPGTELIRFRPAKNVTGYAGISFRAWDGVSGSDYSFVNPANNPVAYSVVSERAWIPVGLGTTAKFDEAGRWTLPTIKEDTVNPLASVAQSVLGFLPALSAPKTKLGLAVIGTTGNGLWQVKVGSTWQPIGEVSETNARLLKATDSFRFVPAPDWFGEATLTYKSWNPINGLASAYANIVNLPGFSDELLVASVQVTPVNDAPVLETSIARVFSTAPQSVGQLTAGAGDIDSTIAGIGITRAVAKGGVWQYRKSVNDSWTNFPIVSLTGALILDPWAEIRFLPDAGVSIANAVFDYKAWDGSTGGQSGERKPTNSTAFSKASETATFSLGNATPSFKAGVDPAFPRTITGNVPASLSLSPLVNRMIDDDKGFLKGLALTGTTGNGTWEYSLDNGKTWLAVGDVSMYRLLLRNTDRVRFTPAQGWTGTASLQFAAWDRTTGIAGDRLGLPSDSISNQSLVANLVVSGA